MNYNYLREVRKVLIITLLLNLFVMALKVVVGYATGSLSLLADALHSVTDSANNVLGLVANKFSSPLPDREHPYGHHKFEAVGALGIAAFLGIACFEIIQGAIEKIIRGGSPVRISGPELWLLLIVLGVNIFVAFYERNVGTRIGSSILVADAKHTMSDVWVTISVLGGLIGIWWFNFQWLDVLLAFPVALLVFWSGWSVLKENLPWLVDQMAIAPEAIHGIATSVPGVINCHDIASRGVIGRQVFIEMHLVVDTPEVETAHQITEEVENKLQERYSPVRIIIHVEPPAYQSENISFGN
ncbi:cation diffusion facilitator family transporter [Cylindrospermopsis raciborskii]|uniref:Cation-efflux pump n=1 Tax=Cylindrospermopsis raciborskii CENA302 TaxID=1170768 RepID=A0A9Q5QZR3_9CYAN|nr:cation diffusion facilitator family transporter [Cylindrospermopsis raciborskii]EFA74042.1 Cation efflux protein [Raphidiopsis brookii D9]MCZ2201604.1 cation diffusion facilitator family transporter [Cylindrospermopsis raciborskii PAMP2012]MCZ2207006.1 cation diffusion facilitator family transporter [Cylindrospermopsis raciborskii PAMP2011]NLQ05204.1 cation transporter [Cylindrospermopsis raciborskii MVCC19]OHY32678.1 cation transporter [Cylindrospermopsis raciborskii MVCC14]